METRDSSQDLRIVECVSTNDWAMELVVGLILREKILGPGCGYGGSGFGKVVDNFSPYIFPFGLAVLALNNILSEIVLDAAASGMPSFPARLVPDQWSHY